MGALTHEVEAYISTAAIPITDAVTAINAIKQLAKNVGIPSGLEILGVKAYDISLLADNALKDVYGLTNPKQASHEESCQIFRTAM